MNGKSTPELTQNQIKLIAAASMLLDHICASLDGWRSRCFHFVFGRGAAAHTIPGGTSPVYWAWGCCAWRHFGYIPDGCTVIS